MAPAQDIEDVTQGSTIGRCDNADLAGKPGNGLFVDRIKETLIRQLLFQLIEGERAGGGDVQDDPGEQHDLSESEPEVFDELVNLWHEWARENHVMESVTPYWPEHLLQP